MLNIRFFTTSLALNLLTVFVQQLIFLNHLLQAEGLLSTLASRPAQISRHIRVAKQ